MLKMEHNLIKKRHLESIRERYGELLDLKELAEVLKYKSVASVRKAHSRKTLPVKLYRFPNKSGWYAKSIEVSESIESMISSH